MTLSVVSTLYRSSPYLPEFHRRIREALEKITPDYEIVLVNDGCPEDSLAAALRIQSEDSKVRVVDLSRNFGHHPAMMCGLAHARGDLVFLIDCDLEEEPELLIPFHSTLRDSGADVVFGIQESRKGGAWERLTGRVFYILFNALSTSPLPQNVLTVRLMTRRYVDALLQFQEREILIAGLWAITGYQQIPVPVRKGDKGSTTYTLGRKISHLVNSITSFSSRPLVGIFYIGLLLMILSFLMAGYLVFRRIFLQIGVAGWASVMVSVWFLGGLTIFCVGVIGIYLSKVFTEAKQRPRVIVRKVYESGESED